GRDGRACISILLTSNEDVRFSRRLARISYPREKVRLRWDSMFHRRVPIDGDSRFWIDLDDVRPGLRAHGVQPGQARNRAWNQRVVTLLQDAALIELDTPPLAETPETFQMPVGVRLTRLDMFEPDWDAQWERARRRGMMDAEADFEAMQAIVRAS